MERLIAACIVASVFFSIPKPARSEAFRFPQPSEILKHSPDSPPAPAIGLALPLPNPSVTASSEIEELSGRFESAPDWNITPGVLCTTQDKDFTEFRYAERIPYCTRNLSTGEKKIVSEWYGVAWEDHSLYQYDHLLSLCLGGSNDLRNIWPMPWDEARAKAKLESDLCWRMRNNQITQKNALLEELGWFAENAPELLPRVRMLLSL